MGCGPSKSNTAAISSIGNGNANANGFIPDNEVIPPPVAFVVPLDDETGETATLSAGLPAPPPRIQKLLEEPSKPPLSPTRIERRLASAERRRQQILQLRAGSTMSGKDRFQSIDDNISVTDQKIKEEKDSSDKSIKDDNTQ